MVVKEDGSTYIVDPTTGNRQDVSGPNDSMAEAFATNDVSALDQQLQAIEAYENSPAGQRANQLREQAYDENVRQFNAQQNVREDAQGTNQYNAVTGRQNAETNQYSAETGRYSAETQRKSAEANIAELERRYGLDVGRFGLDYVDKSIQYAKTSRDWLGALQYERGATPIYQSIAQGKALPAFGAKSAGGMPSMNNITDTMTGLGYTNAGQLNDPTKQIQQVLKAVPAGGSASGDLAPAEIAAIKLATELYRAGGTNVKEGQWESMRPDEQDSLLGVMDYLAPNGGDRYKQQLAMTRLPGAGTQRVNAA